MNAPCTTGWCQRGCNGQDHYSDSTYVPAILSDTGNFAAGVGGVQLPAIGVSVTHNAAEGLPAVSLHISGPDVDEGVCLDWHGAMALSSALDEAISLLGEVMRNGVDLEPMKRPAR